MTTEIDSTWLQARIDARKAQILATEAAITALLGGAQSYTLDTGQTRQTVTKANLSELRKTLQWLESELARLDEQLNGGTEQLNGGTPMYGRPAF